ncbi:MAG: integrase arm-type DNA-binding domain-containing protein [Sideroxyarcus sp.]|nr:integrase arm-type DNA-binding domain-containing protein [Sideroxyarcus sp.]
MGKLTDLDIRNWIKAGERFEGKSDGEGLYLRYRKEDAVPRWLFRYRLAGEQRIVNLGSYKTLSLADARKTAKEMRARVALGYDPQGEKKERKAEAIAKIEAKRAEVTMGQLADEYFAAQILGRWKHPNIVRARIENDIKPNIGHLPIGEVKPQHIDAMLQAIIKRGAPTMSTDVLRWVKRMFDYAMKRQMVTFNPATPFNPADAGGKEESRQRWLTKPELVKLFDAMRTAKGWNIENTHAVKLLLLLAVRREELIAAPLAEFDLDGAVWHLPAERTKTGAAIDIPLPRQAVAILRELARLGNGSAWLLPARKMQERMIPHIDLNTVGAALAKTIRPLMGKSDNFTVHDFRRTARTHLAALGVLPHIGERCLNHKVKGVESIYMRHDFFDERKDALQKWADLLDQLERGGADVIPLKSNAA